MEKAGVTVIDAPDMARGLAGCDQRGYDAVLCLGVIEHVPHTPRLLLETLVRRLRPGGLLIVDTPNLAYLYNRQRLARGQSVMPAIQSQYDVEPPFEGHHREYTLEEVHWMFGRLGLSIVHADTFSYSIYALGQISGTDRENFELMESHPDMRELILAVGRLPDGAPTA
jgi:SAM-dependent methyltransferase